MPSFAKIFVRWYSTVRGLMNSRNSKLVRAHGRVNKTHLDPAPDDWLGSSRQAEAGWGAQRRSRPTMQIAAGGAAGAHGVILYPT
jgi:hypothetical protein